MSKTIISNYTFCFTSKTRNITNNKHHTHKINKYQIHQKQSSQRKTRTNNQKSSKQSTPKLQHQKAKIIWKQIQNQNREDPLLPIKHQPLLLLSSLPNLTKHLFHPLLISQTLQHLVDLLKNIFFILKNTNLQSPITRLHKNFIKFYIYLKIIVRIKLFEFTINHHTYRLLPQKLLRQSLF